jgi:hypothetical protein
VVERAALDNVREMIEDDVMARFPGGGIDRVEVLRTATILPSSLGS